jgi:uncharacterized protein
MKKLLALLCLLPVLAWGQTYVETPWSALVPAGWDPAKEFKGMDLGRLKDSDPRAIEALEKLKRLWEEAPTEPALAGKKVRIAGYAIPLERKGEEVLEFLLVPYFGACIHSPPPPANQIIHAVSSRPLGKIRTMDAVWVSGTMSLKHAPTPWGAAGYRLVVDRVNPYEPPASR